MNPTTKRAVAITAATTAILAGITAPASAAVAQTGVGCSAPSFYNPLNGRSCNTGTISTTSAHTLYISVSTRGSDSPWRVWDVNTGVIIAQGKGSTSRTVTGLYGTYKGRLPSAYAYDRIDIRNY
ncbi:hypothetical protein [Actinoplanes rectilineatus]|uniref:hypothetical protein n=1 Tax=Actinoplanes rectilineatus TaxID=113571 RepID=UPI0005F2E4AC|nr:hypothetical protein [Actinoplanes rectilineatus]